MASGFTTDHSPGAVSAMFVDFVSSQTLREKPGLCVKGMLQFSIKITVDISSTVLETTEKNKSLSFLMRCLLSNGSQAEAILLKFPRCGEVLSAHKHVLSARSPVFRAMFQSNMSETVTGEILVEDINPTTMKEFLSYLYTESFTSVSYLTDPQRAMDMFGVAMKYNVEILEHKCENALVSLLSAENLATLLVFADASRAARLRHECIEFAMSRCHRIFEQLRYNFEDEQKTMTGTEHQPLKKARIEADE
jgi:hypothetical protein